MKDGILFRPDGLLKINNGHGGCMYEDVVWNESCSDNRYLMIEIPVGNQDGIAIRKRFCLMHDEDGFWVKNVVRGQA